MNNRFDALVNKVLGESLQSGNISSIPAAMRGVGTTGSNVPPSSEPQIVSAQTMPKVEQRPNAPKDSNKDQQGGDQEIVNEIGKLPKDVQDKIASAKNIDEINAAIANVDPVSKQKIENYIKNYAGNTPNTPSI